MAKQLNTRILLRNDTKQRWEQNNPVLGKGEIGIVFDPSADVSHITNFKIGDGVTAWNSLPEMIVPFNPGTIEDALQALSDSIADPFDSTQSYSAGALVMHDYQLYTANDDVAAGAFDPTKWDEVALANVILEVLQMMVQQIQDANTLATSCSLTIGTTLLDNDREWDQSKSYSAGDIVVRSVDIVQSGVTYHVSSYQKAKQNIPANTPWDSQLWDQVNVLDLYDENAANVASVSSRVSVIENQLTGISTASGAVAAAIQDLRDDVGTEITGLSASVSGINTKLTGISSTVTEYVSGALSSLDTVYLAASYSSSIVSAANRLDGIDPNSTVTAYVTAATSNLASIESLNEVAGVASSALTAAIAAGSLAEAVSLTIGGSYSSGNTVANAISTLEGQVIALQGNHFEIAPPSTDPDRHPDVANPQFNIIYLVPKPSGFVGYAEWIRIEQGSPAVQSWEKIGDTDVDLSNYYNKTEIDAKTQTLASAVAVVSGQVSDISVAIGSGFSSTSTVASAISAIQADYLKAADLYILDCGNASTNISGS